MVNGDVLEARAVIPQIPPTVPTESPDKTTVPPAAQVVDSGLHVYTLAPATITGHTGNAFFRDVVETNSWVVASIGYYNKQVYHKNTAGDWYLWDGTSAWTGPVADPSGAAPPPVTGTNPGGWDATQATVDPNSATRIQNLLANYGTGVYFGATVARALATLSDPSYPVTTDESISPVTVRVPLGSHQGYSFDELLQVFQPDGSIHSLANCTYDSVSRKISHAFGVTILKSGQFVEDPPNSTSAARLPLGWFTPDDVANKNYKTLCFSTDNTAHGEVRYPSNTNPQYTNFNGNGLSLCLGAWIRLKPGTDISGLDQLETYMANCLLKFGAFYRDYGTTFQFYGSDESNVGGQQVRWSTVGVTLEQTGLSGQPYAHGLSSKFRGLLNSLELLKPPVA